MMFLRSDAILKTLFACMALCAVLLASYSCKDDIPLPPERGLEGEYEGWLIITQNFFNGNQSTDSDHVSVSIRAADSSYQHSFLVVAGDSIADFCDIDRGDWRILNQKIVLTPVDTGVSQTCNPSIIPSGEEFGYFAIDVGGDQNDLGDSLKITQESVTKNSRTFFRLKLVAIP